MQFFVLLDVWVLLVLLLWVFVGGLVGWWVGFVG